MPESVPQQPVERLTALADAIDGVLGDDDSIDWAAELRDIATEVVPALVASRLAEAAEAFVDLVDRDFPKYPEAVSREWHERVDALRAALDEFEDGFTQADLDQADADLRAGRTTSLSDLHDQFEES